MEIAEARQRCTTECAQPNHKEAAACMRQCWATFFAERKAQRNAHPMPAAPIKSRSVAAASSKGRSVGKAKLVHPRVKGRSTTTKKGVAPFVHARHRGARSAASQLAGLSVFLIALVFIMV